MKMFLSKIKKHKWLSGTFICIGVTFALIIIYNLSLLDRYELNASDLRYSMRGFRLSESPVVFVNIDDKTLGDLGRWPFRRKYHAQLIDILSEYGAESIMFDILFMEPNSENTDDDLILFRSIKKAGNVYIPFYLSPIGKNNKPNELLLSNLGFKNSSNQFITADKITLPLDEILANLKGTGYANASPDEDGVIRKAMLFMRYRDTEHILPLISFKVALDHLGVGLHELTLEPGNAVVLKTDSGIIRVPVDSDWQMPVNYQGNIEEYSFSDIIRSYRQISNNEKPYISLKKFKDKVVMIGQTSAGTVDLNPIPLLPSYPMVGIHLSIFDTIISRKFISESNSTNDLILFIFIGLFLGIIIPRLSPLKGLLFSVILFLVYILFNYFIFIFKGIGFPIIYPGILIFFCDISIFIYKHATEEKEKKMIKNIFSTYMTPSVVHKILKDPDSLKLGGERREMTVYFSDLAGFTTLSESLEPEDLVHLINEYLDAMTNVIFKHEGTLDKYEGDAIMAFWNAPTDQPDHPLQCCQTALECFEELSRLQKKWISEGRPPLNMRIGINTGQMIVGNMGSKTRMDYTVMGDSVNLGARLESANKEYGTRLMISEFTKAYVENDVEYRELDVLKVKGKTKPVLVYELMANKGKLSDEKKELVELYNEGLDNYKHRNWDNAIAKFNSALKIVPDDGPSLTYIKRCVQYRSTPPPDDWDGVWELKNK